MVRPGRSGPPIPGQEIVDPHWEGIVRWATVDQPKLQAQQQRELLTRRIQQHPEAERILARFLEQRGFEREHIRFALDD